VQLSVFPIASLRACAWVPRTRNFDDRWRWICNFITLTFCLVRHKQCWTVKLKPAPAVSTGK